MGRLQVTIAGMDFKGVRVHLEWRMSSRRLLEDPFGVPLTEGSKYQSIEAYRFC